MFAGDYLRDRHSGFPFWDFYFILCKPFNERTNKRTDGQTNEQTNGRFVLALPRIYPAVLRIVPYAIARERGRLGMELGFQQNQKLILILRDAILALLASVAVVRPSFRVRVCARTIARNNEQGGMYLRALISLYSGQTTQISMA